ncbi:MAG: hypothetical protein PVF63_02385 [Gammaproteobacteria bacterium]
MSLLSIGLAISLNGAALAQADFSGIWVPVADRAQGWNKPELPLTERGAAALAAYDSRRHDSTRFCMPMGTPRNTLAIAGYPIEILQTPTQMTMIFDGRGDIRRIFLDGRGHPPDPIPGWMGHSIGGWRDATLNVDTIGMTAQSRLSADGLPHSDAMQVRETWRLVEEDSETLLKIVLHIDDPVTYDRALEAVRYFRRAPFAMPRETAAFCQLDQWREQLERHSKAQSMQLRAQEAADAAEQH